MDYKLAKELKDAGFPQNKGSMFIIPLEPTDKAIVIPALEELIEDCEKELDEIVIYIAYDVAKVEGFNPTYGHELKVKGKTPTEAVARLWLELNKK
jgi:hypothetical protein